MGEGGGKASKAGAGRLVVGLKVALLAIFVALLARTLASADWAGAGARLRGLGPAVLLVLAPFPTGLALDATAWRLLLARARTKVGLAKLFHVRVATESLTTALPAGGLAAEALSPFLLAPETPVRASLASSAAKRWLIIRTHGYYVAVAGLVGFGSLRAASRAMLQHEWLPHVVLASAIGLVVVSAAAEAATTRLGLAARVHDGIVRLRGSRLFARFGVGDLPRADFEEIDASLRALGRARHPAPAGLILGAWLLESVETWIILRVLGADLAWRDALAIEASLSVVRTAAVFAPAGLGVQDLGYLAMLEAYGIHGAGAIGPAFLLLKRAKEALYVSLGVGLLLGWRRPAAALASEGAADDDGEDEEKRAA